MKKRIIYFITGSALVLSVPVLAMMSSGSAGHMSTHNSSITGHTEHMTGNGFDHDTIHSQTHDAVHGDLSENSHMMDAETAQRMIKTYMDEKAPGAYHLMNFEDSGTAYCTDVFSHEGKLMDRLIIDKKTGNISSSLKE